MLASWKQATLEVLVPKERLKFFGEGVTTIVRVHQERIGQQEKVIRQQEGTIQEQEEQLRQQEKENQQQAETIEVKDEAIQQKDDMLRQKEETIQQQAEMLRQKEETIQQQLKTIEQQAEAIRQGDGRIQQQAETIKQQAEIIQNQEKQRTEIEEAFNTTKLVKESSEDMLNDKALEKFRETASEVSAIMGEISGNALKPGQSFDVTDLYKEDKTEVLEFRGFKWLIRETDDDQFQQILMQKQYLRNNHDKLKTLRDFAVGLKAKVAYDEDAMTAIKAVFTRLIRYLENYDKIDIDTEYIEELRDMQISVTEIRKLLHRQREIKAKTSLTKGEELELVRVEDELISIQTGLAG